VANFEKFLGTFREAASVAAQRLIIGNPLLGPRGAAWEGSALLIWWFKE